MDRPPDQHRFEADPLVTRDRDLAFDSRAAYLDWRKGITSSAGVPAPKPVKPKPPAPKKPIVQKMQPQNRGEFEGAAPSTPPWLDDFRMQVSARSPRLADCFTGTDRPGALRWTTAVNPENGSVSDHSLEPIGGTADLLQDQRECLLKVLSSPVYKIPKQDAGNVLPSRVGIVIEF